MKTYEEALATLLIQKPIGDGPPISVTNLDDSHPYAGIWKEVQGCKKSFVFVEGILQLGKDLGLCPHEMLVIALSHGVGIGIEMEKQDVT